MKSQDLQKDKLRNGDLWNGVYGIMVCKII